MPSMASNRRLSFANEARDLSRVLTRQILTCKQMERPLVQMKIKVK